MVHIGKDDNENETEDSWPLDHDRKNVVKVIQPCQEPRLTVGQEYTQNKPRLLIRQLSQMDILEALLKPLVVVVRWMAFQIRAHHRE
jgi:hypothetical protein